MTTREINFDGLIGPTHNYAGLSAGNLASVTKAGAVARPRDAALQGLGKMRTLMDLGVAQGFFPPPLRPTTTVLRTVGFVGDDADVLAAAAGEDPALFRAKLQKAGFFTEWKGKFGDEAWGLLEKYAGKIS